MKNKKTNSKINDLTFNSKQFSDGFKAEQKLIEAQLKGQAPINDIPSSIIGFFNQLLSLTKEN